MKKAVGRIPVSAKIRLGWNDRRAMPRPGPRVAVEAGGQAVVVHGRTREARYRPAADWDAIAAVAANVSLPVVGNGDVLFGHEVADPRRSRGAPR